jgi:hypothetical protein
MKKYAIAAITAGILATGCGNSIDGGGSNSGSSVNAPVAGNFAFSALGNSQTVKGSNVGLLTGGTLNGAILLAVQSPTAKGGTVVAQADGGYTYNAPLGVTGTDTFQYEIANAGGRSIGTVTVTLTGTGFFVNNQAAAGGTGTQAAPFQNLAQVQAAAAGVAGAEIVVFQGDGTSNGYNTPFSLGTNQQLHGFSSSATPVLTGPISFSSGNKLEDVRITGTAGTAINATGSVSGTVNRVAISNATAAGNFTDATGTWVLSNNTVQNMGLQGFVSTSSVGSLNWTVSNSSFTNTTICSICSAPTATASQNLTISGSSFVGGGSSKILAQPNTVGTLVGLNVNNCTVNGSGSGSRGIEVGLQGSTVFTGILTGNNVTGCTGEGLLLVSLANTSNRIKVDSSRFVGNGANQGVNFVAGSNVTECAVFSNNTSDQFTFNKIGNVFGIEQFSTFGTRNVGTLLPLGNSITNLAAGTCGLP